MKNFLRPTEHINDNVLYFKLHSRNITWENLGYYMRALVVTYCEGVDLSAVYTGFEIG
jgi:hypothetical protein